MITSRDPWILLIIIATWPVLALFVADSGMVDPSTQYSYLLLFIPAVPGVPLSWSLYKRYRPLPVSINEELENQGLKIQSQRGLSFWERFDQITATQSKPVYWPPSVYFTRLKYKTRYRRIFIVSDRDFKKWETHIVVTFSWENKPAVLLEKKLALT
jgi:hypothetical protein